MTMIFGFTGTGRAPLAPRQLKKVRELLYNCTELHLGDCIHADAQAYKEAVALGIKTIGHPPSDGRKRAFCNYDKEHEPKPYLKRNLDIATEGCDGLIAAPNGWMEVAWSTVRYARKLKRHIWIVRPDGTVKEEGEMKLSEQPRSCERCGKKHLSEFVWLELNKYTGKYHEVGTVVAEESQGLFPFGAACAKTQLKGQS